MLQFLVPVLLVFFLCLPFRLAAQESAYLGSYHSLYVEIPVSGKWSLFNEDELRGTKFFSKYYYNEIKAGVNYKYSGKMTITGALGVYNTFNGGVGYDGLEKKTEYRLWQQMSYKQKFFEGVWEHRVRVEEVINRNFRPSVRYRLQPRWPLNKQELSTGAIFATAYDEWFLQFRTPLLRRNRIYGGAGYYFSENISMQAGLLRQTDYKPEGANFTKNFFYLSGSFLL